MTNFQVVRWTTNYKASGSPLQKLVGTGLPLVSNPYTMYIQIYIQCTFKQL